MRPGRGRGIVDAGGSVDRFPGTARATDRVPSPFPSPPAFHPPAADSAGRHISPYRFPVLSVGGRRVLDHRRRGRLIRPVSMFSRAPHGRQTHFNINKIIYRIIFPRRAQSRLSIAGETHTGDIVKTFAKYIYAPDSRETCK